MVSLGFECYLYLDGQAPEATRIKAIAPDALLVCRLWSQDFTKTSPYALAQRVARTPAMHVIPWNEANLPLETGGVAVPLAVLQDYWEQLVRYVRLAAPDKLLHFPAWSPSEVRGGFWPGADVYDVHCYGDPLAMLADIDHCLALIPKDKPAFISEWNLGMPWDSAPPEWIDTFLDGLAARPQIIGATAFILRWDNPDPSHPNYDLEGTAALRVLASWRPPERPTAIVLGGDGMNDQERQEIGRIVAIFAGWVPVLQDRAARAESVGYGVSDSFESRLADEMQGAVDGLKALLSPLS
ncbi:MAG: hypothetical protein Q8P59_02310 [Dehalococcoidia bacterium]|nr:hypothetical protein [Dehalococcoidia bacterium]